MENKKISEVLAKLNKELGANTVDRYCDMKAEEIDRLPSGSLGVDKITGGGWAKGLMNYITGWESSGKSTLCIYAVAETQKAGGVAAYIDHEYSFDKTYAESLGVNVDEMIISQPNTIEDGYNVAIQLMNSGEISTLIFDSVAAAIPKQELEADLDANSVGIKARINSKVFPQLALAAKKNNVALIVVNQKREKIGVMFGNPETEPGGNATKFYPAIKVEVRKSTLSKDGTDVTGNLVVAKCSKNKTYRPFLECSYNIVYGEGIDTYGEVLDNAVELGFVKKSGSWYSLSDGTRLGQGAAAVITMLKDNPELYETIKANVYHTLFEKA